MGDPIFLILLVGIPLISQFVASQMRSRFVKFSQDPTPFSGAEIAQMMLEQNEIHDVRITATRGQLTDHYNPTDKTVNLSEVVCHERNIAAASVAAHEVGHAVQHATGYPMLTMRSKMVPFLNISNKLLPIVALGGAGTMSLVMNSPLKWAFIGVLGLPALFAVVTLPVEFNASNRALAWMERTNLLQGEEHDKAKKALFWAAMTYVIAALGSIAQLLYYAKLFMGRRR
ncbi:MAG: zinc metallopeptidase [Planctomycetaceae bacterium]